MRVLRITFGPGEKAPAHDHPNSVAVFLSDGVNRLTTDGKSTENPQKRGDVVLLNAGKHSVENVGKTRTEVILIELKKPGSTTYKGMSLDPVKLNPNNYSVAAENEHARVIRIRAAVGDKSVVHEHPSNVSVQLNDSATGKAGTVQWHPGPEKHGGDPGTPASGARRDCRRTQIRRRGTAKVSARNALDPRYRRATCRMDQRAGRPR